VTVTEFSDAQPGFGPNSTAKADPLGPLIVELQTAVNTLEDTIDASTDIADNTADIATLQGEVETATTGLLDRADALEADVAVLQGTGKDIVPISFEAGEVGALKVFFHRAVTIKKLRFFTTLALAGTDAGTITAKNAAGSAMASGVLSMPASSVFGYEPTAVVPSTNNTIAADSFMILLTAKTTAGGKGYCTVEYDIDPAP
jgi:hypothetical protein